MLENGGFFPSVCDGIMHLTPLKSEVCSLLMINERQLVKGGRRIYNIPWLLIHGSKANFSGASTTSQKITRTTWKTYFCVLNPFLQLSEHVPNVFMSKPGREVTLNRNLSVKNLDMSSFPVESYYDKTRSVDGISVATIIDTQPKTLRSTVRGRAYIAVHIWCAKSTPLV